MGADNENLPVLVPLPERPEDVDFNAIIEIAEMNGVSDALDALTSQGVSPAQAGRMLESAGFTLPALAQPESMAPSSAAEPAATSTPVRKAEQKLQPVGVAMDLDFFNQLNSAQSQEEFNAMYDALPAVQQFVYDRSFGQKITPAWAAQKADEFFKMQDERQKTDPAKLADAAVKQGEIQQSYLQELQYQRHIATLNDKNATRAQRAAAINAIDGLAASIGQRMIKGTSTAAVADAKRLVGTVSSRIPVLGINVQEYNPAADYGPQLETMLSGSQERMGMLRQQMEAAGIPLPEAKQAEESVKNPPTPSLFEVSVQKLGVKGADGSQVMLNGAPVIRRKDGKMFKAMPNGKGVELTAEEISQLGL